MWNEDWYSQAAAGWGGVTRCRWTEGIKSVQHVRAGYPLTGAHVPATRAATGSIGGRLPVFQRSGFALRKSPFLRLGSDSLCAWESTLPPYPLLVPPFPFLTWVFPDVYSSWRVLAGTEPPISHGFFYWLICLCFCQQLRLEPGVSEDVGNGATASLLVLQVTARS